eukprot:7187424-Prymnesium_polylepis.1
MLPCTVVPSCGSSRHSFGIDRPSLWPPRCNFRNPRSASGPATRWCHLCTRREWPKARCGPCEAGVQNPIGCPLNAAMHGCARALTSPHERTQMQGQPTEARRLAWR